MKAKKTRQTYNRFAFCHQNEALLFQFFLHECLLTFQKLQNEVCSEEILLQITGLQTEKISPWCTSKGHLHKIQHYHTLMQTYFADPDHPSIKKLGLSIQKANQIAENCLTHIRNDSNKVKTHLRNLKKEVKRIGSLLIEKLHEDYKSNEHILFFFLRRHKEFDHFFGEPIVAKTFERLFSGGLDEAQIYMTEKYSKKGFHHLVPLIAEHISQLRNP